MLISFHLNPLLIIKSYIRRQFKRVAFNQVKNDFSVMKINWILHLKKLNKVFAFFASHRESNINYFHSCSNAMPYLTQAHYTILSSPEFKSINFNKILLNIKSRSKNFIKMLKVPFTEFACSRKIPYRRFVFSNEIFI